MTRHILFAAVACFLLVTSSARGDWQYTKWGMTPEEVIAASQGAASSAARISGGFDNEPNLGLLQAPYQAGRHSFVATFYFGKEDRKLVGVELSLQQENTSKLRGKERTERSLQLADERRALVDTLLAKYGKPLRDVTSRIMIHRLDWATEEDTVSCLDIGGQAIILVYKPRQTTESDRL